MGKHSRHISVVGLGYVGLPVALEFGKSEKVIGFDVNKKRLEELGRGVDRNNEVTAEELAAADILFTDNIDELRKADFHIVAVPTPIDQANRPDLTAVLKACTSVGKALKKGDIAVFESTVYPGVTEDECIPVLEQVSGLTAGKDFKVGYSPERINPGDKEHQFATIMKVVSGQDREALEVIAAVYSSVVKAGVHRASSIKVAEAAKVIENIQRDINVALMNELAIIFNLMGIKTKAVLDAASTKWNFIRFMPGLVGGHCIGVDPYYLTHKAEMLGYHPQVILSGRRINDGMGKYIATQIVKRLAKASKPFTKVRLAILGITFKEDVPDIRNSRVPDIINELKEYGIVPLVHDPFADPAEVHEEYGLELCDDAALTGIDCVVLAVKHRQYVERGAGHILGMLAGKGSVVVDVKSAFNASVFDNAVDYWSL